MPSADGSALAARRPGLVRPALPRPAAWAVAAGVVATEVALQLLDYRAYDLHVRLLDSAQEWSYSHILATAAFATGTAASLVGALARPHRRRAWWVAAGLFAVLLTDNVTRLHEHVHPWAVVYAPVLAGLGAGLLLLARGTPLEPTVTGGLVLLCGSLVIHVAGPHVVQALGWSTDSVAYQVKVGLKEGTELAGWTLLAPAVVRLAAARRRGGLRAA